MRGGIQPGGSEALLSEAGNISSSGAVPEMVSCADRLLPGKYVNIVAEKCALFRMNIKLNGICLTAIVDTGAACSLISDELVCKHSFPVKECNNKFDALGSDVFESCGKISADIEIAGMSMLPLELAIFPSKINSNVQVLLGVDFLQSNSLILDFSSRVIAREDIRGSFHRWNVASNGDITLIQAGSIPCYAAVALDMKPNNVYKLPITTDSVGGDLETIYSDRGADGSILDKMRGYEGFCDHDSKFVLLLCTVETKIKEGDCVGSLDSVVEVGENVGVDADRTQPEVEPIVDLSHLSRDQKLRVFEAIRKHPGVFSSDDTDIGRASVTEHQIVLYDQTPIYQRPRRFPQPITEELERQCQELSNADIIEPSSSPWSSPIVPVRKKDGSIRMCIDYRKLNAVTIPDKFPVPNLLDSIFGLQGTKYFTKLDCVKGYYQIPMEEASKQYTAFSTSRNHWQFKRLSFGLKNAPSAFQRAIQAVLRAFPSNKVIAYIDDILILGASFDEHLELVGRVLQALEAHAIKIKPSKCEWFCTEVEFLGHIVSATGMRKTTDYLNKVRDFPKPTTVKELREFLGLVNFQRKFVPNCSEIQKPLSKLTGGRSKKKLEWDDEMQLAFDKLKAEMAVELELGFPDYSEGAEKLELYVDASNIAAGAYLAQKQGGENRVIAFASMTFTETQLGYSTTDRELTALRWGIKTFKPFLYGVEFLLFTDHQPLIHLHNMKLICSRHVRTVLELAEYNFEIRYIPGHLNSAADALSRLNLEVPLIPSTSTDELPTGLTFDGPLAKGGGDSLFVSLLRVLRSNKIKNIPESENHLREKLVDDLILNASKYGVQLDRESRKALRLMRHAGQLPSLDLLLVACRLFDVRVFVYFWNEAPVIYQFQNKGSVNLYLQCQGGIHFNPLIETKTFECPDVRQCNICTASGSDQKGGVQMSGMDGDVTEVEGEYQCEGLGSEQVLMVCMGPKCQHKAKGLPQVAVSCGGVDVCAVIDSGAEISLISEAALDKLMAENQVEVCEETLCELTGFAGKKFTVTKVAEFCPVLGRDGVRECHRFGVVPTTIFPFCILLGIDYLRQINAKLNFHQHKLLAGGCMVEFVVNEGDECGIWGVSALNPEVGISPVMGGGLRFDVVGSHEQFTGLSLLTDNNAIVDIQRKSSELRSLYRVLDRDIPPKQWGGNLKRYRRSHGKLRLVNKVIVYGEGNVVVVPFRVCVDLAVSLHYNLAHVGRDKVTNLLSTMVWHPKWYEVCSDVCTSCDVCQRAKDGGVRVVPPTMKIITAYPFELMALDLMSLPKTNSGFVACLVAVDHYSKFTAVVPLKNKQSRSVIHAISRQVLPFLPCVPTCFLSDHGPEFISGEFSAFVEECGIEHRLTTPYCPTSNGCVERTNKTIQTLLKTIVQEGNRWDEHISRAVIAYNHTVHAETGMSPSQCLLTKAHNISNSPPLQPELREHWRVGNPRFASFKLGDLVLRRNELQGNSNINKFLPRFVGPYKIVKVNSLGVTYELEDCETKGVIKSHHSKLKIFKLPPKYLSSNDLYLRLRSMDILDTTGDSGGRGGVIKETISKSSEASPPDHEPCGTALAECSSGISETSWTSESSMTVFSMGSVGGLGVSGVGGSGRCSSFEGFQSLCSLCVFESDLEEQLKEVRANELEDHSVSPRAYINKVYRQWFGTDPSDMELSMPLTPRSSPTVLDRGIFEENDHHIVEPHGSDGCAVPEAGGEIYDWDVSSIARESDILSQESFSGFLPGNQGVPPLFALVERPRSVSEGEASRTGHIRTRARGPVENLPNVQPWTLERARKGPRPKGMEIFK